MKSVNSSYIPAVDHIRAFAAVLVLFQHSHAFIGGRMVYGVGGDLAGASAHSPLDAIMIEGHTGVSLFMVLSGFIFTHIAFGRHVRYGPFLLNRFLRIYPLVLAIFTVAFLVKYPQVSSSGFLAVLGMPFEFTHPVNLWFVPAIYPFTTLFWTIAPEFQFYLLFPAILALVHRSGPVVLAVLLGGALLLRVLLVLNGAPAQDLSYWTIFGRIDQFLIGMATAIAYRSLATRRLEMLCVVVLVAMPFVLFGFNRAGGTADQAGWKVVWPTVEGLLWAAFILGYMQVGQRLPGWLSRVLASIGEVSFSMYLLHVAVIAAVLKLGPVTFGLGPTGASFLNGLFLVIPGTTALSWVTFRLIERPFLRLRVRYLGANEPRVAAGSLAAAE